MPNSRFYSSIAAVTNLQVTANPGDTSIQVASSSGWPGSFPYIVSLDYGSANEELVLVTSGGPATFQVTRAYDGTSASTHNAGAVVRHTSSAIDFTDSRSHEAATTGVHGISGAFVDTNSVQTLTNKTLTAPTINNPTIGGTATGGTFTGATLTSPTINGGTITGPSVTGGALSGVFSGNPTFSGTPVFSGTLSITGPIVSVRSTAGFTAFSSSVTGDANVRFNIMADGTHAWGSGSAVADVTMNRSGAGFLNIGGSLSASGSLTATGNLLGADISLNTTNWTTFSPSWTNLGTAAFGTNVGWYKKFGKVVHFEVYAVVNTAGSGSGGVQFNLPSTPFRDGNGANTTRQIFPGFITGVGGINFPNGIIFTPVFASDTGTVTASLRSYAGDVLQGQNLVNGTIITVQGYYREA